MPGFYNVGPIQFHLTVLLSLLLLFSCAPGKDDTEGEDRSTPYVKSISPDNAATGVPTDNTITITFSKAIPPSQVTVDTDWQCSKAPHKGVVFSNHKGKIIEAGIDAGSLLQ